MCPGPNPSGRADEPRNTSLTYTYHRLVSKQELRLPQIPLGRRQVCAINKPSNTGRTLKLRENSRGWTSLGKDWTGTNRQSWGGRLTSQASSLSPSAKPTGAQDPRTRQAHVFEKPKSHQSPASASCPSRSQTAAWKRGAGAAHPGPRPSLAQRRAAWSAPSPSQPLACPRRGSQCPSDRTSRGAHSPHAKEQNHAATPKPRNFFHPARPNRPPTQTGVERPRLGDRSARSGERPRGTCWPRSPRTARCGPRRRPLPPPGGRSPGERVGAGRSRRAGAQPPPGGLCARASARTARAEHVAQSCRVLP